MSKKDAVHAEVDKLTRRNATNHAKKAQGEQEKLDQTLLMLDGP